MLSCRCCFESFFCHWCCALYVGAYPNMWMTHVINQSVSHRYMFCQ